MSVTIMIGDCRQVLRTIAADSVQCVVTSPPYFGLRDYGVDWQIGLEATPEEFVDVMIEVFREVRRVLKPDGTVWLNLGDSYAASGGPGAGGNADRMGRAYQQRNVRPNGRYQGLKPKDLMMIPARVALALQADGWWLRSDIIWSKPNPMPESVVDRPTSAHEHVFLLSKSERYFWNEEGAREPVTGNAHRRAPYKTPDGWDTSKGDGGHGSFHKKGREKGHKQDSVPSKNGVMYEGFNDRWKNRKLAEPGSGVKSNTSWEEYPNGELVADRNMRNVWTIPTQRFPDAHFATFPTALVEPCIKAGSRPGDIVLDPFGGAGTTGLVADRLGRDGLLIELNPDYAAMAEKRIRGDAPLFAVVAAL